MWVLLFRPSSQGVGRLELFAVLDNISDQKKAMRQKTPERKVVRLSDCVSVTSAPKESCPPGCTAFYLNTTQSNYTMASTESQDWIDALCFLAFQVSHISPLDHNNFSLVLFVRGAVLSFGKGGYKPYPSEINRTMRKFIQYL